ncbi:hypothetical protein Pla52o_38360 [Novipirellula galeiformis]|uniref:Uncharacterized protein n=1 Tax=Novipirellula galeiformis TaxID=2528004 RepID=A0A5C6CG14_9BACT|nr:hypothetical protein Pla52o_38360 [Novipirellula galeiformis]
MSLIAPAIKTPSPLILTGAHLEQASKLDLFTPFVPAKRLLFIGFRRTRKIFFRA